jgi:Prion-inhibition and propagation
MEVAGLAVGAAGLAGLFSACVDCFALIRCGRAHGRDLEILVTKLDVEKTRLLQWADAVGLLASDSKSRNPLLDAEHTRPVIERVLNCIVMLMTDGDQLRAKYGMGEENQGEGTNNTSSHVAILSRSRLASFKHAYAQFCGRIALQQKKADCLAKAKWVVRDRQGFSDLTRELHGFIDNLGDLVPVPPVLTRLLVKEDMNSLPDDLGMLRLVNEACKNRQDEWSDAASIRLQNTEIASEDARRIMEWRQDILTGDELTETSTSRLRVFETSAGANETLSRVAKPSSVRNSHPDFARVLRDQSAPAVKLPSSSGHDLPKKDAYTSLLRLGGFNGCCEHERQLIDHGIYPAEYGILHGFMKPNNIEDIKQEMAQSQLFLPSVLAFKDFQSVSDPYELLLTINEILLSHVVLSNSRGSLQATLSLENLRPLTDGNISNLSPAPGLKDGSVSIRNPTPGLCCGARSFDLNADILEELSDHILPSKFRHYPISPNFFLEVPCDDPGPAALRRQAFHQGALGARGMISLQCYGDTGYVFDGNAYTLSGTLHHGILKIYAIWPTRLIPSLNNSHHPPRLEFHTFLVGTWLMTSSLSGYHRGITAFQNALRLTETWRSSFIQSANAKRQTAQIRSISAWEKHY